MSFLLVTGVQETVQHGSSIVDLQKLFITCKRSMDRDQQQNCRDERSPTLQRLPGKTSDTLYRSVADFLSFNAVVKPWKEKLQKSFYFLTYPRVRYFAALRSSLKQRIHRVRPEGNVFLLHHDNARPHCSAQTQDVMGKLKFTMILQPLYSPDLAPSSFWLFPKLKETLKGLRFSTDAEVQAAIRKWIRSEPESFSMNGMKKWIERLNK
ncbi:mariner Mos1 transposase [Trichonephila clavipes]|nr:mariner Mos1 transposase [Trichonephila clavipes]